MSETLYIQTDKNMQVTSEKVHLQDIAQLSCSNPRVLNRCGILKVVTLPRGKYGRYPVSVIEVIRKIQQAEKDLEVVHVGEPEFLLTYTAPEAKSPGPAEAAPEQGPNLNRESSRPVLQNQAYPWQASGQRLHRPVSREQRQALESQGPPCWEPSAARDALH